STFVFFFFQAEDGIRDFHVTGVQTCALPIWPPPAGPPASGDGPAAAHRKSRCPPRPTAAAARSGLPGPPRPGAARPRTARPDPRTPTRQTPPTPAPAPPAFAPADPRE